MSMRRLLTWRAAVLPLAFIASSATVHAQAHITSPKEFFGHNIGDDYWLPNYDQFLTYWKKMDSESNRMQSLVEDLLTLAKVDAHQLQLDIQDVDLEDILDSEIRRLRAVSDLQITTELQPVRVRGDERRLTQVFRNILDNAARHAESSIIVRMERRPGDVVVSVDNDGEIISPTDRNRVFERFARLDASRSTDGGGSGLGFGLGGTVHLFDRVAETLRHEFVGIDRIEPDLVDDGLEGLAGFGRLGRGHAT